jgi:hypothetical protein
MPVKYMPLLSLALLFFSAGLLWADCLDFSRATSWSVEGDQKIIFYRGTFPFAALTLQDCTVMPNSTVRLSKTYMCGSDTIFVDDQECGLVSLDSLE